MSDARAILKSRIDEYVGQIDDLAMAVLRGHLIIEEILEKIIATFAFNKDFVGSANLSFHQKICLARAFSLDEHANEMWLIPIKLNSLRNQIAHSLDNEQREKRASELISIFLKISSDIPGIEDIKKFKDSDIIVYACVYFSGFLSNFQDEAERFKRFVANMDPIVNPHRHA